MEQIKELVKYLDDNKSKRIGINNFLSTNKGSSPM